MGGSAAKSVVTVVVLAMSAFAAYYLIAGKQKRDQQQAVTALLKDSTQQLRQALNTPPNAELVSRLDSNLKAVRAPRDPRFADAAEHYIQGAREIARRRGEAERLTRDAAMSRRALAMHMAAASARDGYWIRVASDLKKRVERDHHDLDISLKTLSHLLTTLPESRKELAPHVDVSLLLADAEGRQAREQVDGAAKRATAELEKVRSLAMPQ